MENRNIWLKPKPTHIDEYFEDFLGYLASSETPSDTLYIESIRLLRERVALLVEERTAKPIYRQDKTVEVLTFNTRLCGAWLLAVNDANEQERKQVLLTMINNLVGICMQKTTNALNSSTFAYKSVPDILGKAMRLMTYDMPDSLTFSWNDLIVFSLDMFVVKFLKMLCSIPSEAYCEGKGFMAVKHDEIMLAAYSKNVYEKKYMPKLVSQLLPEYGFKVSSTPNLQLKESKRDDIEAIEEFVDDILKTMKNCKKEVAVKRLLDYTEGDYVPVEVTEVSSQRIMLKTIDPSYNQIEGQLIFEQTLKIFSKIYRPEVWAKVLKVGDRFNVNVNPANNSFSLTNLFVKYIEENAKPGDEFDSHNYKVENGILKLREFWTDAGFMVYVNLTEEEDEQLDTNDRYAVVVIDKFYTYGEFKGCLYGSIVDYEVENIHITRDEVCPKMLRQFIDSLSEIEIPEKEEEYEEILPTFIKEYCNTLNVLQSREANPMLRYRILSVIRILCTLIEDGKDEEYCKYIAKYIKTLILFAKADSNEGDAIVVIDTPEDLKDEETVTNGSDILKILSCFAKGYDETSGVLDPYIDGGNETLSNTASLVQSYNRLCGMLDNKTLRGIKKQILKQLSVVTDGDSTLELSSELEGIFGEEDDMKEFKTSFFEAPGNAKEQLQSYNIFRGVCAMMNNRGGVLYLGVNDKGVPVGVKNDLDILSKKYNLDSTLDAYMLYINRQGEEWFGETCWKYVTLKPISEHNVVSIVIEPYPYDIVYLKDKTTYLRKNNASAPITDASTIEDIRRRRQENLRKADDKIIILQDAIQKERRVRLIGYKSSNSGTIKNRIVEAFHVDDNEYMHGYEVENDKVKMFRISRAEKIVMLDEPWKFKSKHKKLSLDPFHMSGDTKIDVKLRLKLQAKNAIEESYPGISQYIKHYNSDTWELETFTYNLYPLMVFYLSYAPYVDIVDVKGLKEAVVDYVKQNLHID